MGCPIGQNSLFYSTTENYIKFQGNDLIAVEGPNTVERQLLGTLRFPYKQILKGRVVLKAGQVNYLLNHLGLGDNVTFLSIAAKYDVKSKVEEDNYVNWSFYDDLTKVYSLAQFMLLTGNSTNRVKQLYLTNPNADYPVILDIMVANIDDTYNFFPDTLNQTGTTFANLVYTDLKSHVIGESIKVVDINGKALIYIKIANIEAVEISDKILIIDDSALGKIFLAFKTENDAKQAYSRLNYVLENPNADLDNLPEDTLDPILYWYNNVGNTSSYSFITFDGATAGPYSTTYGTTFSATMSLSVHGTDSMITKSNLIDLLIDNIYDSRDGTMSITVSSINLTGTAGGGVEQINGIGSYSMTFNFMDIAGNGLDGVILNLTITT
jgi:hypothetical protein